MTTKWNDSNTMNRIEFFVTEIGFFFLRLTFRLSASSLSLV